MNLETMSWEELYNRVQSSETPEGDRKLIADELTKRDNEIARITCHSDACGRRAPEFYLSLPTR